MNSNDKAGKQKQYSKPSKMLPLMTPRNLAPATPMRFNNSTEEESKNTSTSSVKKEKRSIPLPPGYIDRAAQRRQGHENSIDFEDTLQPTTTATETKAKLTFLEESEGSNGFPTCSSVTTERLMNLILNFDQQSVNRISDSFKPNEAFLQFKSIEETKSQPFDPFYRPKKVFRSSKAIRFHVADNDEEVLERVQEALGRLKRSTERNQKYLKALAGVNNTETPGIDLDIFPESGRFDESSALIEEIEAKEQALRYTSNSKSKAKSRLFSKKKLEETTAVEIDIFDLIAQKSLKVEDDSVGVKVVEDGGLFGFTEVLPKLSRLDSIGSSKLSGPYSTILSEDELVEKSGDLVAKEKNSLNNEDDDDEDTFLYPGHLENDPITFDSDEDEDNNVGNVRKGNKRKLAKKEDKEVSKVEKLVKSKFGVDLTK